MSFSPDPFDSAVFGSLAAPRSARGSSVQNELQKLAGPERQHVDLDALIHESMLDFTSLVAADKSARIVVYDRGYRVQLGSQRIAFDMGGFRSLLEADNEGVDLSFSDDLLNYTPDEGLVRKTKVPLWVIKPMGGKTVLIQRVF